MALTGITGFKPQPREARRAMDERDDLTLLEDIASRRDRASFTELFSRYEKRAYNLAHHLTRNHDLAQDAVQDAMLDIWLRAATFRPGNTAGWILRIVANKSITLARRQKQEGKKMREQEAAGMAVRSSPPTESTEREEQLGVLRETLERLPLLDRQVLALSFAGGLTQAEIGAALSLSQASISTRLEKACAQVRAHLAQAGYAAALPLVTADGLGEAFCSGHVVPPGLRERVLECTAEVLRESLRTVATGSRLAEAAKSGSGAWILGTAAAVVATAGLGALWYAQPRPQPAPARNATPVAAVPLPEPAVPGRNSRVWDFNSNAPPQDLTVLEGEWHPVEKGGFEGSGCMETDRSVRMVLDVPIAQLPVAVSCQIYTKSSGALSTGLRWERHQGEAYFITDIPKSFKVGTWCSWRRLVSNDAILSYPEISVEMETKQFNVNLVRRQDRARLLVWFGTEGAIRIDNLRLESIAPAQAPDVRPFMAALEQIPLAERTGEKMLQGSKSPIPGKMFLVKFFPESAY